MWRRLLVLGLAVALGGAPAYAQSTTKPPKAPAVVKPPKPTKPDGPPPAEEEAEPEIPKHRLFYENLFAARINPLGLQEYLTVSYRLRLMDSDSVLFRDTFFSIGPTIALSPAFAKGGLVARVSPIALLDLQAMYRFQYYFGTFDQILGFPSTTSDWSDSGIKARGDEAGPMAGHEITLQWRVQAAVSKVAIRNTARYVWQTMDLPEGMIAFYDQTPDIMAPNNGWVWANDLDVIGMFGKLRAGVRYTAVVPWYGEGEGSDGNQVHRVGPLISYTFKNKPGSTFDQPAIVLISQWHVVHRFRTGQDVSQALPYLALAFTFQGDLIPWK